MAEALADHTCVGRHTKFVGRRCNSSGCGRSSRPFGRTEGSGLGAVDLALPSDSLCRHPDKDLVPQGTYIFFNHLLCFEVHINLGQFVKK